jgi:hypothetical protein
MSKLKVVLLILCAIAGYLLYPSMCGEQGESAAGGEVERNVPNLEMLEKIIAADYPEYCQMLRPGVVDTAAGDVAIDIGSKLRPLSIEGNGLMVEVLNSDVQGKVMISATNFMKLTLPKTEARLKSGSQPSN